MVHKLVHNLNATLEIQSKKIVPICFNIFFLNLIEFNFSKKYLLSIVVTKHDFIEENSDQTVLHNKNNSIDNENFEMETSDSPYPFPMKSISHQKELIPIKAILSLVIFYRGNKPGITLTWDVRKSNDTLSKLSRYEECKDASFRSLIKEYEIYGYKETKDKSNYKYKTPWQMVSKFCLNLVFYASIFY